MTISYYAAIVITNKTACIIVSCDLTIDRVAGNYCRIV